MGAGMIRGNSIENWAQTSSTKRTITPSLLSVGADVPISLKRLSVSSGLMARITDRENVNVDGAAFVSNQHHEWLSPQTNIFAAHVRIRYYNVMVNESRISMEIRHMPKNSNFWKNAKMMLKVEQSGNDDCSTWLNAR
ncbi:MAG: hypothetical protein R3F19_03045 [Verrucomicrobiales bacterium]